MSVVVVPVCKGRLESIQSARKDISPPFLYKGTYESQGPGSPARGPD